MASTSGSKAGLVVATVVTALVAVTAVVFAFIFSAEATKNRKDLDDLTKSYNQVIRKANLGGPVVQQLKERRDAPEGGFTPNDELLSVATRERDDLAALVGGQTPVTAITNAKAALTQANTDLKNAGLPEVSTSADMAGTIKTMSNAIATLASQNKDLAAAANDAKAQAAKTVEDTSKQLADKDKQIEEIRGETAKAVADAVKGRSDLQGVIDQINKDIEENNKKLSDAQQQLSGKLADETRTRQRIEKERDAARQKLALFRPDTQQSVIRQPDGSIARLADDGSVYISLGAGDQIVAGMTFEVYDKATGVPALKTDETSLPVGKGSLEVMRVTPNSAQCRVIKVAPGRTLQEGDVIANLIYDRNTKYNFVVYGKFDISKKGAPDTADASILKRLVSEWGGKVQDQISTSTDFLVIGAEPKIPEFSEEQRRDPVNAKILTDAQAELDAYYATLNKARELFIPVLNQNRFLYYVGYYDLARR
jgi:hypothetical protein